VAIARNWHGKEAERLRAGKIKAGRFVAEFPLGIPSPEGERERHLMTWAPASTLRRASVSAGLPAASVPAIQMLVSNTCGIQLGRADGMWFEHGHGRQHMIAF
jgi:hypothetical protein